MLKNITLGKPETLIKCLAVEIFRFDGIILSSYFIF